MGWWQVDADTLAGGRFVLSPLAEATACLFALADAEAAHPGERAWLDTHLAGYRARLAADPITALLVESARRHRWIADFLTPAPDDTAEPGRRRPPDEELFAAELARVRDTPAQVAHTDLEATLRRPLPAPLHRPDLPERAAALLEWVWTRTVLPYWPRRRRVLEADIAARADRLARGGWAAALGDLRPGMRWLGRDRLQINTQDRPPRDLTGVRLLFVPVTPRQGWVSWELGHRYAVVYPCLGPLAATDRPPVPQALARLLGPARATVLILLADPKTTTQLVALTGQTLGSVGRHLKILHDAGLIARHRTGRSVHYRRTPTGDALAADLGSPGSRAP